MLLLLGGGIRVSSLTFSRHTKKGVPLVQSLICLQDHTNGFKFDPALLHLAPNSPEAKEFHDFANSGKKSNSTATPEGKN